MFGKQNKNSIYAIASLAGTIIGVGLFSLPYITSKVGIFVMGGYFLVLGFFVIVIHSFFGEVALNTPDFLRLPGYAKLYFGNWAKNLAIITTIFGSVGSLLAYIIVGGEFLNGFFSDIFGGNVVLYTSLYFLLGATSILIGIRAIAKIEFWGLFIFFGVLIFLFIKGFTFLRLDNLFVNNFQMKDILLPYGPILFSLWGATMIPEIEEMLIGSKQKLKKVIIIAILIPAVVYTLFTLFILSISGNQTTEAALTGLSGYLGQNIIKIGYFFGILTTFTSFIAIGLSLRNVFHYDLKFPKILAWVFACFTPFFLFLLGFKDFIKVIGFVGATTLSIDGLLILFMYRKINNAKYKKLTYPLIIILIFGIVYELFYFFK